MAGGLGAVGAVFAAAASFDVHKRAHLDGGGVVEAAVDCCLYLFIIRIERVCKDVVSTREGKYSSICQLAQRRLVDLLHLVPGPVRARHGRRRRLLQHIREREFVVDGAIGPLQDDPGGQRDRSEGHCGCAEPGCE